MKPNTASKNAKPTVFLWLYMAIFCLCITRSAYSDGATNRPLDFVEFFKQAISSPPDIAKCVVKRTNLKTFTLPTQIAPQGSPILKSINSHTPQYFEGALSGTNFFLRFIPDPDRPTASNHLDSIVGRSGSSAYEIGGNGVEHGVGENTFNDGIRANFGLSRQLLCMGAGAIAPGTVKWDGNEFTAINSLGKNLHGMLQVSNNLPLRLEVGLAGDPLPYEAMDYTYATPADSFGGYPARFLMFYKFNDGLEPLAEIEFKSVLLATQQLSASFFSETRFADRITYTNVFSNSDFYASNAKTKQLVKANSYLMSGGFTNSKSRTIIYSCLIFVTLLPVAIFLIWSVRSKK